MGDRDIPLEEVEPAEKEEWMTIVHRWDSYSQRNAGSAVLSGKLIGVTSDGHKGAFITLEVDKDTICTEVVHDFNGAKSYRMTDAADD